jgi:hypothetical protein
MSAGWSRRRLLGATLALAGSCGGALLAPRAALGTGGGPCRGATPRPPDTATLIAVQDGRYVASRRYAAELAVRAPRTLEARADLARQWYGGLRAAAARGPLRFAGLTTWADFLVMRGCAAECGLRQARHELVRDAGGRGCTLVRWQIGGART